jgi:adenine-specific DNA-methyltransferase
MGLVKEKVDKQKLRGGYYTPEVLSDFICDWAINSADDTILEPSCGDGNFLESAAKKIKSLTSVSDDFSPNITGVELVTEEAEKAKERLQKYGIDSSVVSNTDFFHQVKSNVETRYDVIVGNPPFIRYQNFPEEHRTLAFELMNELGFSPNRLTNIWVPFLVIAASLLEDNGRLGMVIPAELFQVKYAGETRVFLSEYFDRINIVTFKKLVFDGIQQEVVILLCEKSVSGNGGIRTIECDDLDDLKSIDFESINGSNVKSVDHSTEKWTKYFLTQDEINLLRKLKNDLRVIPGREIMDVNVGIVTGRNKFFMLNEAEVAKWNLEDYTIPVISRSNQLEGLSFSEEEYREKSNSGETIHLFLPPDEDFDDLPSPCQKYIKYGESQEYHEGYKCRIRKRWYIVSSLWIPNGFSLRQVSDFPKIVVNDTNASATDTIHRVKFNDGIDPHLAAKSFINSLTFAFSEITGRSYGGGVMTFEPSEMKELRWPKLKPIDVDFSQLDELLRKRNIEQALDIVDKELLIKQHGFSWETTYRLRDIWRKLSFRRNSRK